MILERVAIAPKVDADGAIESQKTEEQVGGISFGSSGFPNVGFQSGMLVRPVDKKEYIRDPEGAKVSSPKEAEIHFQTGTPQLRIVGTKIKKSTVTYTCLLYTSPSPRDATLSRMPSSA